MSSLIPVEFPQNFMILWLDSKDSKYRSSNSTNSLLQNHFWCGKTRFKNQVTTCSDFPPDALYRIKEVEMVYSLDELKSSRSVSQILRCWMRGLRLL